ncbi:unnamed protein product (macronuclear) [Paramecium tetraurelia]|uniref:Uncharacterized protein n=1 Tax=Paramecium tetraurelia TaxID=5888 RepID=A0BAN0_PARTE|nr:uncharacterized protein GSPATT00000032001 [Paramecium tetraurelia]CAK55597.1 unnamed protein product [Paramecium tetraurelia]|eukprot:XP_001422995.1 hypothetical protein (macronuclear) [Paramecium tetraurelia strain d4-2]
MDKSKLVQHTSSLNTNLQYYLNKFEKNQEWADIAPLLMKIEGLLKQHPSPYIIEKIQLSKRLAQCLNPHLSAPIHMSVLKIYDQLFKNMASFSVEGDPSGVVKLYLEDLALYSIGLLPFFSNASSKVRPQFLDLIKQHYVPLGRELIPMLPGLVASILPGLDDQQEANQKNCMSVLDELSQSAGRKFLIGSVWMSMLRSSKCRSSSIKYLSQKIPKMQQEQEDEQSDYMSDEYEEEEQQKSQQIIAQEQQQNQLKAPQNNQDLEDIKDDSIIQAMDNKAQNEIRKRTIVVEQSMELKRKQALMIIEDGIDEETPENNFPPLYVSALISSLEDENQLIKRQALDMMYTHLKSNVIQESKEILVEASLKLLIRKDLSVTRRVNQWLFGKPDMDNKYQITEQNKDILQHVANSFNKFLQQEANEQNAVFPIKLLYNFFMEHDHMVELLIGQVSFNLIKYVETNHKKYPEIVKSCKRLLESITSFLLIVVNEVSKVYNTYINFLFSILITKEDNFEKSIEFTLLRSAAANLMTCLSKFSPEELRKQSPGSTLNTLLVRMEQLPQQLDKQLVGPAEMSNYDDAIEEFGQLYQNLSDVILDGDEQIRVEFESISKSLIKGLRFKQNKEVQLLPKWFTSITKIIKEENPSISLLAIQSMIEILISEKVDIIYENLKKLIIEESRTKMLKNQIVEGQDYTKLTLEKLWNLLDYPFFHERIIEMIVNLSKVFPTFFTEVVIHQFKNMQEAAIRRFALFWKLSATHYKELQDLNKVGLFLMLDFLDHENPIIRHNAKNWLLESTEMLERILDPLFEVLIQSSSSWYLTDNQQIFFAKVYETKRINETIKKLKSILISFSARFMEYVQETEISSYIKDIRMHFTNESSVIMQKDTMMYLDLLVIICLKYVQGQAIESMSLKFYKENAAVNASACEYIELLIVNVENPIVSLKFAEYIMQPLQIVLYHAIENEDLVMQVQILNLFKVIFFNSSFRTKFQPEQRELIEDTMSRSVSNSIFIPTLLRGMHTHVLYVRAQYIHFISTCIPLLAEHLRQQTLTDCVQQILTAYFKMIKDIANRQYEQQKSDQKMNQFDFLQGSSQHEIQSILIGVKTILKHILGLQERDDMFYEKMKGDNTVFNTVKSMITFGLLNVQDQSKTTKLIFQKFQNTCEVIISTLPSILELYINCWSLGQDFIKYSDTMTAMGIGSYSFDKFNSFNKILQEQQTKETNIVKPQILQMMKPLFMSYSKQFMTALLSVWSNQINLLQKLFFENEQILIDPFSLHQNTFLLKTIEIMIMMQCPIELFLDSLLECQQLQELQKYYDIYRRKKLSTTMLNFQISQQETNILYFLYCYFTFAQIDPNQLKKENLLPFWVQIMKILQILALSKSPSTNMWLLELQLLLTRKYSPKEIVGDQRFRNQHHEFINDKLKYVAQFGGKLNIFWNDPGIKSEGDDLFQQYSIKFKVVTPLTPTLYDIYLNVIRSLNKEVQYEVTDIEKLIFSQLSSVTEDFIQTIYRLMCIKTLKNVALELLQNSYAVEKTERVVLRCKEMMDILYPLLENRSQYNQIYVQMISEMLYFQLDKARQVLLKVYKDSILNIFNKEDFFIQSKHTLKYWTKIINWVVQYGRSDLFTQYLEQVAQQSSFFFSREGEENKRRIRTFERICFLIFSGERDRYTKKLDLLIEKISEVIKSDSANPGLVMLILFCVRILILRLSPIQLNELFRNMWPTLLTLLISIFKNKQSNQNLVLAALKLVEMISFMQQDEFFLHQWIFIYDYFGIKIQENQGIGVPITPFLYQPYCSNFLFQQYSVDYSKVEQTNVTDPQKREIIIKQIKVDGQQQLEEISLQLCNYLVQLNSIRIYTANEDIEDLIENDFIQLDQFIYEIIMINICLLYQEKNLKLHTPAN